MAAAVPGVEYFESDLMPGKPMFRCVKLSASLQVSRCASMWQEANDNPERMSGCRSCKTGAAHAGAVDPSFHRLRGLAVCSRCQRADLRLIGGNVCVGCKNREYEWVKGKNAKGKFPSCHPPMSRRSLSISFGGRAERVTRTLTVSTTELVVELLRDRPSRVVFGLGKGRVYVAD
jgi:hypothetical protein